MHFALALCRFILLHLPVGSKHDLILDRGWSLQPFSSPVVLSLTSHHGVQLLKEKDFPRSLLGRLKMLKAVERGYEKALKWI